MFWRSRGFPHAPLCPTFPDGSPACQQCIWVDYWGRFPSGVPLRMKSLSLQAKAVSLSCPVLDEDQRCWTVWESPKESLLMLLPSILAVSKIVNSHLLPFIYLFFENKLMLSPNCPLRSEMYIYCPRIQMENKKVFILLRWPLARILVHCENYKEWKWAGMCSMS